MLFLLTTPKALAECRETSLWSMVNILFHIWGNDRTRKLKKKKINGIITWLCLQWVKEHNTFKWTVHLLLLILFVIPGLRWKGSSLLTAILFQAKGNTKTEIPWNLCVKKILEITPAPVQYQKPKFYFPLKFPVISFWKPTCKNLVGQELLNNICQSWNFKEVVKTPNNSKPG